MQAKVLFGGEGAKIPMTDFGLSFALFKLWLSPAGRPFAGYTTASNQGLLGAAIIETPVVDIVMRDLEDEEAFMNLHGALVDVTIAAPFFVKDGGVAQVKIALLTNDSGPRKEMSFNSDQCRGFSAAATDVHFVATLLELPSEERDPTGLTLLPF
jgi:hypothetical protein